MRIINSKTPYLIAVPSKPWIRSSAPDLVVGVLRRGVNIDLHSVDSGDCGCDDMPIIKIGTA